MKVNTTEYYPQDNPNCNYDASMCHAAELFDFLFFKYEINTFCEIGCYVGGGIKHVLSLKNDLFICAIDTWDNQLLIDILKKEPPAHVGGYIGDLEKYSLYDSFITNIWEYRNQVLPLKMDSIDGIHKLHELKIEPDVIYIDSSHEYENTKNELNTINNLFDNTIICGDDYDKNHGGVCPAVDEFVEKNNYTLRFFDNGHSWLIEKARHIQNGFMCGQELSSRYKKHCNEEFIKFKNDNPNIFKNEHMDVNVIFKKITDGERFSACRFSDGEYLLMKPQYKFMSLDNALIPGQKTKLGEKLKDIIKHTEKNFKIGITMEYIPNLPPLVTDYTEMINKDLDSENLWTATLGGYENRKNISQFLENHKYSVVLVANENYNLAKTNLNIKEFFPIPTDGIEYFEKHSEDFINDIKSLTTRHNDTVFVIAAGMLANVICYEGWKLNKTNWYLDLGHGFSSR
jgi:hypothetical protein